MASSGIFGAAVLALGRAMGETMALAMLVGNNNQISASLFAPANTIASLLANSFGEATGLQVAALMYLSFILMVLTLGINAVAECHPRPHRRDQAPCLRSWPHRLHRHPRAGPTDGPDPQAALAFGLQPRHGRAGRPRDAGRASFRWSRCSTWSSAAARATSAGPCSGSCPRRPAWTAAASATPWSARFILVAIGALVSVPVGVLTAIFLTEYSRRLAKARASSAFAPRSSAGCPRFSPASSSSA